MLSARRKAAGLHALDLRYEMALENCTLCRGTGWKLVPRPDGAAGSVAVACDCGDSANVRIRAFGNLMAPAAEYPPNSGSARLAELPDICRGFTQGFYFSGKPLK